MGSLAVAVESNGSATGRQVPICHIFTLSFGPACATKPTQNHVYHVLALASTCFRKLAFAFSPPMKHSSLRAASSSSAVAPDPAAEEDKRTVSVRVFN